jgi:hypothetical protein
MRKKKPYTYFLIFFALLTVMSLPKDTAEKLQGSTIAFLAPTWEHFLAIKTFLFGSNQPVQDPAFTYEDVEKLRIENNFLQTEIIRLKEMMQYELKLLDQMHLSQNTCDVKTTTSLLKKRHRLELQNLLQLQLQAIPARIILEQLFLD